MKTLTELYTSILSSAGLVVDNQGFVSTLLPGSETPKPFSVDAKRLVLPIPEQLKQTDWSNRIGFHPGLQSLTGGESRVMEKFRDRMNGYADFMFGMLLSDIAQLGVNEELHKDLTPVQAGYLGPFSDADQKFVKLVTDLVATKRVTKKNYEFIRFSVIKGRSWQGQKRARVAVMHFPLYEALPKDNKPTTILGHKLRIVDVKMLRAMYEFLFPGIQEPGHYEIGSDSKIAPSLEALMALYAKFIDVQNAAVSILEPVIKTSNALLIVNDWRDDLADFSKYLPEIRKIPLLEGNAPSERIAQANAPQRISDTPIERAVKTIAAPDTAPTVSAATITAAAEQATKTQEVQQVQGNTGAPRFKLGVSAPTVSNATHQITDAQASNLTGLSYARPAPAPVATTIQPTPPVGSILAEQNQQFRQPQQLQQQQQVQQQVQAMKVPETARLINGALYIPVESSGVSGIPQGAVLVDGKPYIPLQGVGVAQVQQPMQPQGRFGMQQQQITDPAQIPGLTPEEINFYRGNPVMFQNFLAQMHVQGAQQNANVLAQRSQQIPRYLRTAAEQAQQQQFANRGFFNR